jgi:hypothetical protein
MDIISDISSGTRKTIPSALKGEKKALKKL